MKRANITKVAVATLISSTCLIGFGSQKALALSNQSIAPEVQSTVWEEDGDDVANVTLNGKELLSFRGSSGQTSVADKADEIASKLQELMEEKQFNPNDLLPVPSGDQIVIQYHGQAVMSLDNSILESKDKPARPTEIGWKLVNDLRTSFGAPVIPAEFLKVSKQVSQNLNANLNKLVSSFSGNASWYGGKFHGRKTSDGHRYDQEKLTAAHRTLPFGTKLLVMNKKTGHTCVVEVNDRGPFVGDRVIDLSRGAAKQLDMLHTGVAPVACMVLGSSN